MTGEPVLGVIGGSGLYTIPGLTNAEERRMETPFGEPSAPIVLGDLEGQRVAFLARHGVGHHIAPSQVNYRANIFALKMLGVRRVVSISACGSLREDYAPGDVVVPDQLYDHTHRRARSFFDGELVVHVSVAEPFCPRLSQALEAALRGAGGHVHRGGTSITIEGPRFSTRAESNIYRSWGISLIGMTTAPEAFLAREAEMCYAVMAHITDYDVWHVSEEPVTVEMVVRVLEANTHLAQQGVSLLLRAGLGTRECACGEALKDALITMPERISPATLKTLEPLLGAYLR
jgi:5'-methylthioadenosine phosphorylase